MKVARWVASKQAQTRGSPETIGVALKVVAALKSLANAGADEAAEMIPRIFLKREIVDGEWLRGLRRLCNAVEISASQPALAVERMKSILISKTQPRRV